MIRNLPDISRFYTALSEWFASIVYITSLNCRFNGWKLNGKCEHPRQSNPWVFFVHIEHMKIPITQNICRLRK